MKYCPKCKIRMPDTAAECTQCGGAVRVLGLSAADAATGDAQPLVLRLQGLQHEVEQTRRSVSLLATAAGVLVACLLLLLVVLHARRVAQYAQVTQVEVNPLAAQPGTAEIVYSPQTAGKIEFVRTTPERTETLTDLDRPLSSGKTGFVWAGKSPSYSIRITYRSGWRLVRQEWSASGK